MKFAQRQGVWTDARSGKNAFALAKVLAEAVGRSFIETALDSYVSGLIGGHHS